MYSRLPTFRSMALPVLTSLAAVLIVLLLVDCVSACPTCKEGVSHGNTSGIHRGYYWSILLMMSMPFAILCGISLMFYLSIRRARRQLMEENPFDTLPQT